MQDVRKGSLVKYNSDLIAKTLKLGATIGIVSMIHHDDLAVVFTDGRQFIDRRDRFVVLSF